MISPDNLAQPSKPAPGGLRSIVKRGAFGVYKVFLRPVVRPLMWRFRTFLLQPVFEHLARQEQNHLARQQQNHLARQELREEQVQLLKSLEAFALTIASGQSRAR